MTIYFAPEAEADFVALVIDKLAARAFEGTEQTLGSGEVVRSWAVPPVRIYYQRHTDAFWVLRIYHQGRPPIAR